MKHLINKFCQLRPLLAVYVGNVATEAWINALIKSGTLPVIPHFEVSDQSPTFRQWTDAFW